MSQELTTEQIQAAQEAINNIMDKLSDEAAEGAYVAIREAAEKLGVVLTLEREDIFGTLWVFGFLTGVGEGTRILCERAKQADVKLPKRRKKNDSTS